MPWLNADGLYVKFGAEEGATAKGGAYSTMGPLSMTEVKMDLPADAPAALTIIGSASGQLGTALPDGVRIEAVEVVAETAATSGGAATLTVGLKQRQDRTTNVSTNGILNALALTAIDAAGERSYLTPGSTGAGALIGTTIANGGFLAANFGTAAFTAGKVVLRVYWYKPQTIG